MHLFVRSAHYGVATLLPFPAKRHLSSMVNTRGGTTKFDDERNYRVDLDNHQIIRACAGRAQHRDDITSRRDDKPVIHHTQSILTNGADSRLNLECGPAGAFPRDHWGVNVPCSMSECVLTEHTLSRSLPLVGPSGGLDVTPLTPPANQRWGRNERGDGFLLTAQCPWGRSKSGEPMTCGELTSLGYFSRLGSV